MKKNIPGGYGRLQLLLPFFYFLGGIFLNTALQLFQPGII